MSGPRNLTCFSVIMPCYNSAQYLDDAIRSVVNQSFEDWELLICDDSSTDESLSIATNWCRRDARIRVIPNSIGKGAPAARNSCLSAAQGRYVAFLDSDDIWLPEKLAKQYASFQNDGVVFSFSSYFCIDESGRQFGCVQAPRSVGLYALLLSNFIGCLTACYDRNFFGLVLQPNIKKRNDYALWLTLLSQHRGVKAVSISEPLAAYRVNSYGLSSNKYDAVRFYWRCIRDYGGVNVVYGLGLLPCYLSLIFVKKFAPDFYNSLVSKIGSD